MILDDWAAAWSINRHAVDDLRSKMGQAFHEVAAPDTPEAGRSEAAVLSRVRLAASQAGMRLFRNNVGAGYDEGGNFMRWGLANDSKALNTVIKSGDLIGLRPRIIVAQDVGKLFGQFVSLEVKRAGWHYTGNAHEKAQQAWIDLVVSLGGEARFVTSEHEV